MFVRNICEYNVDEIDHWNPPAQSELSLHWVLFRTDDKEKVVEKNIREKTLLRCNAIKTSSPRRKINSL